MFKWFKELSRKQSRSNIHEIIHDLIEVANQTDENIRRTGTFSPDDQKAVLKLKKKLFFELMGPLTFSEVKSEFIDPTLNDPNVSEGARIAIKHVFDTAVAGSEPPEEDIEKEISKNQKMFDESTSITFFQGNVSIKDFDQENTTFKLHEHNTIISIRNDTHIRLVEDITKIPSMHFFEIIAPMTAIKVIEGQIPENYLHEFSLAHYLALRKHYHGY